jgi:hypothetical protein
MSKGAGRIEQGVRAAIAAPSVRDRFYPGAVCKALFGVIEPTRAQRETVLRAFRRITRDQAGWRRELRHGEVVFVFDGGAVDRPKSQRTAAANLLARPVPQRQLQTKAAARRRTRRMRLAANRESAPDVPAEAAREESPLFRISDALRSLAASALLAEYVPEGTAAASFRAEVKALVELLQVSGYYAG